ncbi:MAG: polyprenyl synthetase family protein [Oribacterium sp.]
MKKEFSLELRERTEECEAVLRRFLPREEGLQAQVIRAMNYSLLAGGKRLRPLLMHASYVLLMRTEDTGAERLLRAFMAAMEMIHTFSLCHDDLPCMDGDRYRRGQESTWFRFGEDMGTLAGDALSLYAFQLVSGTFQRELGAAERERLSGRFVRALFRLSESSGIDGMLGGQAVDVEKTGKPLTEAELLFIYRLKTGALCAGALEIGGMLAGASEQEVCLLREIGEQVGIAFQIQDDILDETSTEEELGKPIHSDAGNGKTTYVRLHGIEGAEQEVRRLSEEALSRLRALSPSENRRAFLEELIRYLIHRKS